MHSILRFLAATALLICFGRCSSQNGYVIQGKLVNLRFPEVYLEKYMGNETTVMDTAKVNPDGSFIFTLPQGTPVGLYKVKIGYMGGLDIIFNNANVSFTGNAFVLPESAQFIESPENTLISSYLRDRRVYMDKVKQYKQYNQSAEALKKRFELETSFYNHVNELIQKNTGTYAAKLIVVNQVLHSPDYDKNFFKENGEGLEDQYLKDHFFDRVNFMDESLIRSPILYFKIKDYVGKFLENASNEDMQQLITKIMNKAGANNAMNDFILKTIFEFLERLENYEVISWLAGTFSYSEVCTDEVKADMKETMETFRKLAVGNPAPDFQLFSEDGQQIKLYDIKTKYTLLLFWSISCEHCMKLIPKLKPVYDKYSSNGLEVVTVSFDGQVDYWKSMIAQGQFKWLNLVDYAGEKSPVKKIYHVVQTPKILLLDSEKKIVAKLYDYDGIVQEFRKDFGY